MVEPTVIIVEPTVQYSTTSVNICSGTTRRSITHLPMSPSVCPYLRFRSRRVVYMTMLLPYVCCRFLDLSKIRKLRSFKSHVQHRCISTSLILFWRGGDAREWHYPSLFQCSDSQDELHVQSAVRSITACVRWGQLEPVHLTRRWAYGNHEECRSAHILFSSSSMTALSWSIPFCTSTYSSSRRSGQNRFAHDHVALLDASLTITHFLT